MKKNVQASNPKENHLPVKRVASSKKMHLEKYPYELLKRQNVLKQVQEYQMRTKTYIPIMEATMLIFNIKTPTQEGS